MTAWHGMQRDLTSWVVKEGRWRYQRISASIRYAAIYLIGQMQAEPASSKRFSDRKGRSGQDKGSLGPALSKLKLNR